MDNSEYKMLKLSSYDIFHILLKVWMSSTHVDLNC